MRLEKITEKTELAQFPIGSFEWWDKVSTMGTPIHIPCENNQTDLIFIWRKQTFQSDISAVYIEINGIINHHDFNAARLAQHKESDVYYYVCRVDNSWNGTYALIPVPEETVQPSYQGDQQQQVTQHRNWIMKRRFHHIADPLSKSNLTHGKWGEMHSPLYLDPSVIHPAWYEFIKMKGNVSFLSECREHNYDSEILQHTRRFWSYSTGQESDTNLPLVVLLDGEFWVESMPIMNALDFCTQQGILPPAVYLMIDAISFQQRAEDLTCNPIFWQAVIEEMIPAIAQHYAVSSESSQKIVAGQSYGGLSALYAVLNWPDNFGNAIAQSPSFWWPDHSLIHNSHQADIVQSLPESLYIDDHISSLPDNVRLKVYMEVGKREDMMVPLARHVHNKLTNRHHDTTFNLYDGGHDRLIWREGLIKGLIWLMTNKVDEKKCKTVI